MHQSVSCFSDIIQSYELLHIQCLCHLWQTTLAVRTMKMMGINTLFVTNAAGGINRGYNVGDIMIIKDHVNLAGFAGVNPLVGVNDERYAVICFFFSGFIFVFTLWILLSRSVEWVKIKKVRHFQTYNMHTYITMYRWGKRKFSLEITMHNMHHVYST